MHNSHLIFQQNETRAHHFPSNSSLMETKASNSFTTKLKGDVILHIFKAISLSLTLTICFIIIHLELNTSAPSISEPNRFDSSFRSSNPFIYADSYVFAFSLVKATEQLQDAISLILSNVDGNLAWRNCSGSVLKGWGEIQDAAEHVIMNPFMERPGQEQRAEMASQIADAEGFIESCLDDLEKVESTAADQVRARLLLAKVHLRGRGDFLVSYYEQVWNRVIVAACGVILENFFYIIFCGLQLFLVLYMLQKLSKFRSTD